MLHVLYYTIVEAMFALDGNSYITKLNHSHPQSRSLSLRSSGRNVILGKEREALEISGIIRCRKRQESWLRPNCAFHINGQSDSSLKRIITEPHVPSRGSPPKTFVFSGNILIIKEKFRVFLENLGIRGKICNILFKKCVCRENFIVIGPEKFFSAPFLYVSGKIFWCMSEKKRRRVGGENFNPQKNLASPK